ncbi:Neurexin-1 [Aphelenchoides besseyi]|nr:Neurexin-1 [Aphelenchoides besseyi]
MKSECLFFLLIYGCGFSSVQSLILSGSRESYARYPKWAQTFENQLSFEFKTKSTNALLLYTDDGDVQGNFYVVTIVDGHIQLDFRLGDEQDTLISRPIITLRVDAVHVSDNKWHKFLLFQAWENVKIQVDETVVFKLLSQRSFIFGNLRSNNDVFIGGLPSDIHHLSTMSTPLRRHTKRFAGSVKNLIYRLYPQGVSSPQLIDSVDTRLTDDDYCTIEMMDPIHPGYSYCRNGGRCYNTNDGPKCDCTSDFEGRQCEKSKLDSELSFYGSEWIGYDVSNNSAAVIFNRHENVSLMFKTKNQNGLLFVAGDRQNYVQLTLDRGILIAASKLYGSDKRIIRQRYTQGMKPTRYDDDRWHTVFLHRDLRVTGQKFTALTMKLTVDGNSDEVKQFASDTEWLGNSFAFVGGAESGRSAYVPSYAYNFKGCMKKIKYEADVQLLDIIDLADQGYGKSVIRTGGDLAFSCLSSQHAPPDVLSFNDAAQSFIQLPKWNSLSSGSFQFRTHVSDGLILYHGVRDIPLNGTSDYVAFEISDGHLFLIIDLGSGHVRLQTTAKRVNEGNVWHSVSLERVGRQGSVMVDTMKTDFNTPGVSANLIIEEPIYIGGAPWLLPTETLTYTPTIRLPSTIWSAQLRLGFVGCLKNVRINGINAQIATAFLHPSNGTVAQHTDGISVGCTPFASGTNFCAAHPCRNFGRCSNGHSTFICDCSNTVYDGPTCELALQPVDFDKIRDDLSVFQLPDTINSEAEMIEIKFRTTDDAAVLLDTRAGEAPDRIMLILIGGELSLRLDFASGAKHIFTWGGTSLNDNHWHTARVSRRGMKILTFLDGKWEHSHFLPESDTQLLIEELSPGRALRAIEEVAGTAESTESQERYALSGELLKLTINQHDILRPIKQALHSRFAIAFSTTQSSSAERGRKPKQNTISIGTERGFAQYAIQFSATDPFHLSLKFKTLASSGLLLVLVTNVTSPVGKHEVLASLELVRGKIRYRFGQTTVVAPDSSSRRRTLNDLKWHTISIQQEADNSATQQITVDNEIVTIKTSLSQQFTLFTGRILLGGIPTDFQATGSNLATVNGFRGCLSALRVANKHVDLVDELEASTDVHRGCQNPSPKCGPHVCRNGGICHQGWRDIRCDCSKTSHSGTFCDKPGTSYEFDGHGSAIYYEFTLPQLPNSAEDFLVLTFQTQNSNGVLFSVQCAVDGDYLTVFVGGGYLQVRYNLGSQDHHVGYFDVFVNDNREHILRMKRVRSNLTLLLDQHVPIHYTTSAQNELFTLNSQRYAIVGAAFNVLHSATVYLNSIERKEREVAVPTRVEVFDEFSGTITGLNFNNLMILDLFANGDPNVYSTGQPKVVNMAARESPFDPAEFPKDGVLASEEIGLDNAGGFFQVSTLGCLSAEQHADCDRVIPTEGFFTPVLPKALDPAQQSSERNRVRHSKTTRQPEAVPTLSSITQRFYSQSTVTSTQLPTTSTVQSSQSITSTSTVVTSASFKRRTAAPYTTTTQIPRTQSKSVVETAEAEVEDYETEGDYGAEEEDDRSESRSQPATYAPYARARLVNSGPNELDGLWTDLKDAVEFKSGASWRRPTTTIATTPRTRPTTRKPTIAWTARNVATSLLATTSKIITTNTEQARLKPIATSPIGNNPLAAVRPTTPFGPDLLMTTTKATVGPVESARTEFVLLASLVLIVIIAITIYGVFKCCRTSSNDAHNAYPMAQNGKTIGVTSSGAMGYTPIPSEMSPPTQHAAQFATMTSARHVGYDSMNGSSTLPAVIRRAGGGSTNGVLTNGYQPLAGQVVVNANGQSSPARTNGNLNEVANGGSRTLGSSARKKEFKEWYV